MTKKDKIKEKVNTNKQTIYIESVGRKYALIISYTGEIDPDDGELVFVDCDAIGMHQKYLRADLPLLIADLPVMIEEEQEIVKNTQINIRISLADKVRIEENSRKYGFASTSEFLKNFGTNPEKFLQIH